MDPDELTRRIHRELARLPAPRAPETLLPRVMAALGAPAPWYRRPWLEWPRRRQVASLAPLAALVAAILFLEGRADSVFLIPHLGSLRAAASALISIWQRVEPAWLVLSTLPMILAACCAAALTTFTRLTSQKALES